MSGLNEAAVLFTFEEIRAVRMGMRWGVPFPEPAEIKSARLKLEAAEVLIAGPSSASGASPADTIRCTSCGGRRPQDVIDCPTCDVPSGHVHGRKTNTPKET